MSCPPVYNQCLYEGQSTNLLLKIHNTQDLSYDLTGMHLLMTVKEYKADDQPMFEIVGTVADPTTGMVFFPLSSAQTATMTGKSYVYDVAMYPDPSLPNYQMDYLLQGKFLMEERV